MLTLSSAGKRFDTRWAVHDVSLTLRRGEVFGLLGPNGAGKTTTVRLLAGLLAPDTGTVELDGLGSPAQRGVRARIGVCPQSLALYEELTADENLRFFGQLYGLRGRPLADRVDSALDFVGLRDRRHHRARTYSGGMLRRLNLAIALLPEPELLICDEPTVGVDPQSRALILERIRTWQQQGRTVVYTTHYMEEAERICDRVGILDNGHLLAVGSLGELLAQHGEMYTVSNEVAGSTRRHETSDPLALLNEMQRQGQLGRFQVTRPDLESLFLRLTGHGLRD
jgi:ABC-2 type transport system ATP-binding protein